MNVLTRGKATAWAHRIRSVIDHQRGIIGRRVQRQQVVNDLMILEKVVEEIAQLDGGPPPAPAKWMTAIAEIVDRERAMIMGLLLYNVVADIDHLEAIAIEIEAVARKLATTGEWALPAVDPTADTHPGLPCPTLPKDDDADPT